MSKYTADAFDLVHVAYQDESNGHVYTKYEAEEVKAPKSDEGWLSTLTPLYAVCKVVADA